MILLWWQSGTYSDLKQLAAWSSGTWASFHSHHFPIPRQRTSTRRNSHFFVIFLFFLSLSLYAVCKVGTLVFILVLSTQLAYYLLCLSLLFFPSSSKHPGSICWVTFGWRGQSALHGQHYTGSLIGMWLSRTLGLVLLGGLSCGPQQNCIVCGGRWHASCSIGHIVLVTQTGPYCSRLIATQPLQLYDKHHSVISIDPARTVTTAWPPLVSRQILLRVAGLGDFCGNIA